MTRAQPPAAASLLRLLVVLVLAGLTGWAGGHCPEGVTHRHDAAGAVAGAAATATATPSVDTHVGAAADTTGHHHGDTHERSAGHLPGAAAGTCQVQHLTVAGVVAAAAASLPVGQRVKPVAASHATFRQRILPGATLAHLGVCRT